jgi:serine/threonine protein kinase
VLETISKNNLYTTLLAEHRLVRTRARFTLKVYSLDVYASPDNRRKQEERLLRDADALHRLAGHPNIVQAHPPFPWEDNKIVLPVEWVDGYALRGLLDADTRYDSSQAIALIRQVCEGLVHAHRHGVIHRDLTPENIVVPQHGPLKLVNFDCARVEGDAMHTIRTRLGRRLDERYLARRQRCRCAAGLQLAGTP